MASGLKWRKLSMWNMKKSFIAGKINWLSTLRSSNISLVIFVFFTYINFVMNVHVLGGTFFFIMTEKVERERRKLRDDMQQRGPGYCGQDWALIVLLSLHNVLWSICRWIKFFNWICPGVNMCYCIAQEWTRVHRVAKELHYFGGEKKNVPE